jgi:hypothetical protein
MTKDLATLIEAAKKVRMTIEQQEDQRRSFAYGNAKIENDLITRETVNAQAELLKAPNAKR